MKKGTFKALWAGVQTFLFLLPLIIAMIWIPYSISHDQHMVDTVNDRAFSYEHPNGTITDFTEAEIMDNDAKLEYEERAWKLEHQELYWIEGIVFAVIMGLTFQMVNVIWNIAYRELY